MGFSIAAGLAGFAKRGMQFNDEQRQLTNENIKAAVNLTATDALAQRAARKKIKTDYRNTATQMKSMGMNEVQIEAAYGEYGNDAYTKIKSSLNDHITNWKLTNDKNGTSRDWTIDDTRGWLAQQFSNTEGVVGRSIEEQAQARADTVAPMTTANFADIARGIVAGSGEITMASSDSRANKLAQQMQASFDAASGGIKETADGATFNAQGVQVNLQPTAAEIRATQKDIAATSTAESGATTAGVAANFAQQMAEGQLEALTTDNLIKQENLDFLKENNPLLIKALEGRIEGQDLANTLAQATQGNDIAMSEINLAIAGLNRDAKRLDIKLKELKLDQDPQLFEKQMEQLGLSIEGMTFDNMVKEVTADNAPLRAELAIALDTIQVEQGALRTTLLGEQITDAKNKNALADVEADILNERLSLLQEQVKTAKQPSTFQAAFLEIDQAIGELDPSDPGYDYKKAMLDSQKEQVAASLAAYTDASTANTSTDPKFPSLINGYNKALKGKLESGGFVIGTQLQVTEEGISWIGEKFGPAYQNYQAIRNKHDAQYHAALSGFDHGPQAAQALDLTAPPVVPEIERMVQAGGPPNQVVAQTVTDFSQMEVGEVYQHPQYGLVQVVVSNGAKALNSI